MEDDPVELLRLLFERHLPISVVEEFRVTQPGRQHLAVALDDPRAVIRRINIGGADKGVGQFAVRVRADEIFLIHARRQLDHLGRHLEERRVEAAEQRHRPFGEAGIFDEQPLILDQLKPGLARCHGRAERDDLRALILIDDDMSVAELVGIGRCALDADRA